MKVFYCINEKDLKQFPCLVSPVEGEPLFQEPIITYQMFLRDSFIDKLATIWKTIFQLSKMVFESVMEHKIL